MKIPEVKLILEFRYGDAQPFAICVRSEKNTLGVYTFKTLDEAAAAYKVAWNVFASIMAYLDEIKEAPQ